MEIQAATGQHDLNLASRKAEESALRRFDAAEWLESFVGPIGLSTQPSEREFISCLRNGLILCKVINKIHPGAVLKVVEKHFSLQSLTWDSQSLPAYQYFENVRNFLNAVEVLNLPAFEASDLDRDNVEAGSAVKIVDCILALKSYNECKQIRREAGFGRLLRSPPIHNSVNRMHSHINSEFYGKFDMSSQYEEKHEGFLVKELATRMICAKENINDKVLSSYPSGNPDAIKQLTLNLSSCLGEQFLCKYPAVKVILDDLMIQGTSTIAQSKSAPLQDISKSCRSFLIDGTCEHQHRFQVQEKLIMELKSLVLKTKGEYEDLRLKLQRDMKLLGNHLIELSASANGYQKVVQENRKLYNMVMDLKGNIRVFCRIRPAFTAETKNVIDFVGEDGSLVVLDPTKPQKDGRRFFNFNRIFGPASTQDEIFKDTQPLVRSVMDGYNACIFAYGQTGSGKTHTMSGPSGGSAKDMGINFLALNDLFHLSSQRRDMVNYEVYVQMVEIYNEQVRDLLSGNSLGPKLEIRSCATENGMNLPDATMHRVESTVDVLCLMKLGEMNRAVGSTAINNRSSRSHSVVTVHVHGKDGRGSMTRSCLHLVDLAGSERVNKSEVTGDRMKEAQSINRSLSCLGDVITALAQKSSHIPYRNSKLTLLLQDSLGGHAKTLMLAHISPEGDSLGETMSTLKFAQRVSSVELGAARLNKETSEILELREENESLKRALAMAGKEARSGQSHKSKDLHERSEQRVALRNPLNPRRLNIEISGIDNTDNLISLEDKKEPKTPTTMSNCSHRSSMEGPKFSSKKDHHRQDIKRTLAIDLLQDKKVVCEPYEGDSSSINSKARTPRNPKSAAFHKTRIAPPNRLLGSPEKILPRRGDAQIVMHGENNSTATVSLIPSLIGSSTGENRSHISKSIRSIGKLINGSEKRILQRADESKPQAQPIVCGSSNIKDRRSQSTLKLRAPRRRESLGSVKRSRRSSLGATSTEPYTSHGRSAGKTPPREHSSPKGGNRWV